MTDHKYSKSEIYEIIDKEVKKTMQYKSEFIKKNGIKHREDINRFDIKIATLSELYNKF